ncbi:hypothetical protein [Mycoplasma procyoni]|uniref:hypothetical protein n=1 Tax=Mycoplasma procyoni TaxID=568784 RepID=UPI00197C540C|nr:hypothetical protein [Mycoplasma procyoni]MBN3534498.1 hypothetical protein [Mycoplasma procyoni]
MIDKFYCSKRTNKKTKKTEFTFKKAKINKYKIFDSLEECIEHFKSLKLNATMWLRENGVFVSSIKTRIGENPEDEVEVEIIHFEPKKAVEPEWDVTDECDECAKLDEDVKTWAPLMAKEEKEVVKEVVKAEEKKEEVKEEPKVATMEKVEVVPVAQHAPVAEFDYECEECRFALENELGDDCFECSQAPAEPVVAENVETTQECKECKEAELENKELEAEDNKIVTSTSPMKNTNEQKIVLSSIECEECNKMLQEEQSQLINGCEQCDSVFNVVAAKPSNEVAQNQLKDVVTATPSQQASTQAQAVSHDCKECQLIAKESEELEKESCGGCATALEVSTVSPAMASSTSKPASTHKSDEADKCAECQEIEKEIAKWESELSQKPEPTVVPVVSSTTSTTNVESVNSSTLTHVNVADGISSKILAYNQKENIKNSDEYVLVNKKTKEETPVEVIDITDAEDKIVVGSSETEFYRKETIWTWTNYALWFLLWFAALFLIITIFVLPHL